MNVRDFTGFDANTIRKPLSLQDFMWAWERTGCGGPWTKGHLPWMDLELGSYEQVRLIFDYHAEENTNNTCVNIIHSCNRVLEERYSQSSKRMNTGDFCDYVHSYCEDGSNIISAFLRTGIDDEDKTEDETKYTRDTIKEIDAKMDKSSGFSKNVWRGMTLTYNDYVKFKENGSILFKNFVSTSFAPIMWNFGVVECRSLDLSRQTNEIKFDSQMGITRRVRVNMNIDCEDVKHIIPGHISNYPEECEVILNRNVVIIIEEILEYLERPNEHVPKCFIRAKAVPLSDFTGPTLVV